MPGKLPWSRGRAQCSGRRNWDICLDHFEIHRLHFPLPWHNLAHAWILHWWKRNWQHFLPLQWFLGSLQQDPEVFNPLQDIQRWCPQDDVRVIGLLLPEVLHPVHQAAEKHWCLQCWVPRWPQLGWWWWRAGTHWGWGWKPEFKCGLWRYLSDIYFFELSIFLD